MDINFRKFLITLCLMLLTACQTRGGSKPIEYLAPDPKAAEINMRLGLSYLQRGEYKIALEKLQKALKQNPNLPAAHNTIGLLHQRLNQLDEAESHFKEAVDRSPDYSEAQNNYGVFLCQQQRYEEAEQRFLKAIENPLYASPAQALENAGTCVSRIPNMEKAESYFRKALQRNPTLPKSLIRMAKIRFNQMDYIQTRAYVERYKSVAPWTASTLFLAIKTENKLNDQNAVASYALLLQDRFPDSDESKLVKQGQY